jgi:hypothetical protein
MDRSDASDYRHAKTTADSISLSRGTGFPAVIFRASAFFKRQSRPVNQSVLSDEMIAEV